MIIEIQKSQLEAANAANLALLSQIESLNRANESLRRTITGLQKTIENLERLLLERDESLTTAESKVRGLSKLISPKSEKQRHPAPASSGTEEERWQEEERRKTRLKARGNNGARRNMHFEMETVEEDVLPESLESLEGCTVISTRDAIRYKMIPPKFIKYVYHIITVRKGDTVYNAKAPLTPLQNSSYDGSFIAGMAQLRYLYSIPVERIVSYFGENGFEVDKATAHGLLKKTAWLFENLYKSLRTAVKEDDYLIGDETYHRVLDREKDVGSMKGYFWGLLAVHKGLSCFFYENGSRSQEVILKELSGYVGVLQSDGLKAYKNVAACSGGNILRAACLQHCKRGFLDDELQKNPEAMEIAALCNRFYSEEHRHRIGIEGWTEKKNLKWRKKYSVPILSELKGKLKAIKESGKYPSKSQMYKAANYMLNEWDGIEAIFTRGDVHLDTNAIERLNRYLSLSRKNSMFFGSHAGAKRGCIFYSLACSCRLNGINFFEYLSDILNKAAMMQNETRAEAFRHLLPDEWKKTRAC